MENIKLHYEVETKIIEIPFDKKQTYEKIIKRITKICKFIKLPIPISKEIENKKYYAFGYFSKENQRMQYHDIFNNKKSCYDIKEAEAELTRLNDKNIERINLRKKMFDNSILLGSCFF